jgi:hypothetical protein
LKKVIVYALLFFYVAVQLRPLAVVLEDALAHTFYKMQHMATVHYEDGKYHIHKDLKAISDSENDSKKNTSSTKKVNENINEQIVDVLIFDFTTPFSLLVKNSQPEKHIISGFTTINSPPPKLA